MADKMPPAKGARPRGLTGKWRVVLAIVLVVVVAGVLVQIL